MEGWTVDYIGCHVVVQKCIITSYLHQGFIDYSWYWISFSHRMADQNGHPLSLAGFARESCNTAAKQTPIHHV